MCVGQEPSPLVLQSATGRFRGKWVDAEVFGKEGRDGGVRYLLFNDDYHDPFHPDRAGTVRVVATSQEEKGFRLFCSVDLAGGLSCGNGSSGSKHVTLSGYSAAISSIITNMEPILASGRGDGFPGAKLVEPSFWLSWLSGFPVLDGEFHRLPTVKTYRRPRIDLRERALYFCGKWVELDALLISRTPASVVLAAFVAVSIHEAFSGELWIEKENETFFALCAEARSGDSRISLRETGEDLESLRVLGFRWASSFSSLGRHSLLQPH